jgi:hypothetical protein
VTLEPKQEVMQDNEEALMLPTLHGSTLEILMYG